VLPWIAIFTGIATSQAVCVFNLDGHACRRAKLSQWHAALPLVTGLIEKGMAPGAALSFLVGGGVTSIPAALAIWALARPPVFAAYLGLAAIGALLAGLAYSSSLVEGSSAGVPSLAGLMS